ncbi:hypothetical protein [Ekhidna sp.]
MIVLIITVILLALIAWVLFTPIILRMDTIHHIYDLRLFGVVRTWLDLEQDELTFHLKLPFYHYRANPSFERSETIKKKKKPERKNFSFKQAKRIRNVLRSFRFSTLKAALDTGNYAVNAQLIPLGVFLMNKGFPVHINFQGNSYLMLEVRNTFWRISTAYLNIRKYN